MKSQILGIVLCLTVARPAAAQHEHPHDMPADTTHASHAGAPDTMGAPHGQMPMDHDMSGMTGMRDPGSMDEMAGMASTLLPDLPMSRDGSGTSWQPDTSPTYGVHANAGGWGLMFHGSAWLRYNAQDAFNAGSRGDRQFDAPNWFMLMAQHALSRTNQIGFRAMLSLDPVIMGGRGYPLLFQTGESYKGNPLIDRQHPHDLFSELAVVYGQKLGEKAGFFAYAGLAGEPALGPPAFMHRPSAVHLPDSPLGHHWQDATHIVFGTATLGFRYDIFKLDGSIFSGAEPNENRYNIDRPDFNSYSLRLSANPTDRWALQASRGFLKEPEALHPGEDQWRTSASAMYVAPIANGDSWATTLIWGMNQPTSHSETDDDHTKAVNSLLLESDLHLAQQAIYGRAEWVQKPAEELGLAQLGGDKAYGIGALTLGTSRQILSIGDLRVELGGHGILYAVPSEIQPVYGKMPVSLEIYLRLSPPLMHMNHGSMSAQEESAPAHDHGSMRGMPGM